MKKIKFISIFLIVAVLVVACAKQENVPTEDVKIKAGEKVLNVGAAFFAESLDPGADYNGWHVMRYGLGETLVWINEKLEPQPWVAEKFERTDDSTWKFTIKDGIKFHNGRELKSEDVKESIERTIAINDRAKEDFKGVEIIVEGNTLVFKTENPDPLLHVKLAEPMYIIVDAKAAKENEDAFVSKPIATGAYYAQEFTPKEKVKLLPFAEYWNGSPKLSEVNFRLIADANTRNMALQSGEVDVAIDISSTGQELFKGDKNITVDSVTSPKLIYLILNPENEFLKDKTVRMAINHAINKKDLAENVLKGTYTVTDTPYATSMPFKVDESKILNYDINKAKTLLSEAGFEDTNKDGVLEKGGKDLTLDLITYTSRADLPVMAQFVQGELLKVGIKVEIQTLDALPVKLYTSGDFGIGFDGYTSAFSNDPKRLLDLGFSKTASDNFGEYFKSDILNDIVKALETEGDIEKRNELGTQAQNEILDKVLNVFLSFSNSTVGRNNKVKDFYVHPIDFYQMNVNVDIEEK